MAVEHERYTVQLVVTLTSRAPGPDWDKVAQRLRADLPGRTFMIDNRRVRVSACEIDEPEEVE
jgi:hypothetical protein